MNLTDTALSPTPQAQPNKPRGTLPPRLSSRELFRYGNEVLIEHQGQEYRLRLTRNDKLILNK